MNAGAMVEEGLVEKVAFDLMKKANTELPRNYSVLLRRAMEKETDELARAHLKTMLEADVVAKKECRAICQDTGIPIYYVTVGSKIRIYGDIKAAINRATEKVTKALPLRENVVHPLTNANPGTNVGWGVPYIYYDFKTGAEYLEITAVPKGGGGSLVMLYYYLRGPRFEAIKKAVLDSAIALSSVCPPQIYGICIGGTPSIAVQVATKAVFRRPAGSPNPDPKVAKLEKELLEAINGLGIGPMNLGGDTTALAVHIEIVGAHTVTPAVAIAYNCWPLRYATARIHADGSVEHITHTGV